MARRFNSDADHGTFDFTSDLAVFCCPVLCAFCCVFIVVNVNKSATDLDPDWELDLICVAFFFIACDTMGSDQQNEMDRPRT